jgi:peptide/nickel transport system substrate-binding protein
VACAILAGTARACRPALGCGLIGLEEENPMRLISRPSKAAVFAILAMAVSACFSASPAPSSVGSNPAASQSTATGGTVRIGIAGSADSLNPGNGLLSEAYDLYELMYDTPIAVNENNEFVAELATDWDVADDGVTWTLTIRDDAKFHDGTPLTAEDVAFSITLYRDTTDFYYLPAYPDVFESIKALDSRTVEIVTSEPVGNFESRMVFMYVLPKHIWEDVDPVEFDNKEMIGSGSFKLVEFKRREVARLEANKEYWGGPPNVDEVIFQTIQNSDARVQALVNGEIDAIDEFPVTAVPAHRNTENIKLLIRDVAAGGSLTDIIFNMVAPDNCPPEDGKCTGHPALQEVAVRQALATATNKQELIEVTQGGLATPGLGLVPIGLGIFYASDLVDYAYDPAAAAQMLEDAGYRDTNGDGIRECKADQDCPTGDLTFRFNFPTDSDSAPREAQLLADQWGEVGVELDIQGLDPDTLTSVCCPAFDFDVILWGWGSDPDPQFLLSILTCAEVDTGTSETGYCNPEYDRLYEEQGVETDLERRIELIKEMQRIALEDVPYIIPYYSKVIEAYRTDTFTSWPETDPTFGLGDPTALNVVRPVK